MDRTKRSRVEWGHLRRLEPISAVYGFDRGKPVDRYLIERFLQAHAGDIRGSVLEVADATYTQRFGGGVTSSDVLDVEPTSPHVTLLADLNEEGSLPEKRFDCVIFTQTLHLLSRPDVALRNLLSTLRPGGVILLTAPCLSRLDPTSGREGDRWRYTPAGLQTLLAGAIDHASFTVGGRGNLIMCTAFLHGLATEELRPDELEHDDPDFPLIVSARIETS